MNETENNTNIESEELNNDLLSNKPADSSNVMDNLGFMDTNSEEVLVDNGSDSDGGRNVSDNVGAENTGTQSEPPAENTDVSDGNAAHMEGNADVETGVSDGDLPFSAVSPVSAGDTYNTYYYSCSCGDGYESPFTKEDVSHISGTLDALLLTASGILFFILFAWAEKKISNGIRKMFHRMKVD